MISEELKLKLRKIKLLVMDVDGTLTDAAMYYSANGEEFKRFSTRDGMGITLLRYGQINSAIITSEDSPIAAARAKKLKIDNISLNCTDKTSEIKNLSEKIGISLEEMAYIGDDVNDLHAMKIVGVSAAPSDAVAAVKAQADYICSKSGGNGAVREFCEAILIAQDKSIILNENWKK